MIHLNNVHKQFRKPLLRGINLHLAPGTVWGLIGPATSGKSVLLKLIAGLLAPDAGEIKIGSVSLVEQTESQLQEVRRRIGMLFQNNALFDFLTVLENVAFPLIRAGANQSEAEQHAAQRLRSVGLAGSEHKYPSQLSGGMRKRVGIARASISHPEIVIYDEPTAGLDPVTTQKIYDLMAADQQASKSTVLVVSSDVEGLRHFASRLALLYQGQLLFDGDSSQIADSDNPIVRQFVRGEIEGPL